MMCAPGKNSQIMTPWLKPMLTICVGGINNPGFLVMLSKNLRAREGKKIMSDDTNPASPVYPHARQLSATLTPH
jgi:hypothetical protein